MDSFAVPAGEGKQTRGKEYVPFSHFSARSSHFCGEKNSLKKSQRMTSHEKLFFRSQD